MNGSSTLNLIHLFDFYLAVMFLASLYRRMSQYRAIGGLVLAVPGRWPRLFELVRRHGMIFLTWNTFLPALLALVLSIIQMVLSRLVFPGAELTFATLAQLYIAWPILLVLGSAMIAFDLWGILEVSTVDQAEVAKYFDEAEYWLRSWTAPVVHFFTLGKINPRQMVSVEVQKALVEASQMISINLWWITTQVSLRIAFGLALWLTYALGH
jgi:hypothetical protein